MTGHDSLSILIRYFSITNYSYFVPGLLEKWSTSGIDFVLDNEKILFYQVYLYSPFLAVF